MSISNTKPGFKFYLFGGYFVCGILRTCLLVFFCELKQREVGRASC